MGFVLKSAMGLGCVYYMMFASAAERVAQNPAATLCVRAASARLQGDDSLRAEAQAARCLMAMGAAEAPPRLAAAEKLAPPTVAPVRPGGLTEADLAEPWFGPGGLARKSPRRG